MKICWDNLEGVCLTRNGTFRKGEATYVYREACIECGEPYLAQRRGYISSFCGHSCASSGKNNVFFGKTHSIGSRRKMSKSAPSHKGHLNHNYKGGIKVLGFTTYDTHKNTLGLYEDIRKQKDTKVLEVRCVYCGQWFAPTYGSVRSRMLATNSLDQGECRLYCSENCKQACPTFGKKLYPKGFKQVTSREVSTYLRKIVLERDNWECKKCGNTIEEAQLHVHHMDPAAQNPMFQNDADSCITLCKTCHKFVHRQQGCRYIDLRCKSRII